VHYAVCGATCATEATVPGGSRAALEHRRACQTRGRNQQEQAAVGQPDAPGGTPPTMDVARTARRPGGTEPTPAQWRSQASAVSDWGSPRLCRREDITRHALLLGRDLEDLALLPAIGHDPDHLPDAVRLAEHPHGLPGLHDPRPSVWARDRPHMLAHRQGAVPRGGDMADLVVAVPIRVLGIQGGGGLDGPGGQSTQRIEATTHQSSGSSGVAS
jgi:hypothetical protein